MAGGNDQLSDAELAELGAREVVAGVRAGRFSCERYAALLIDRAEARRDLNAIISLDAERVLGEARRIDGLRAAGVELGPLAGLPLVVKDQIEVAGYATTLGHSALRGHVARRNAAVVETLVGMGAIVLAKTNCGPMVGDYPGRPRSAATNNNPYFGPARNPYDPTRMSGGSSGGNAVAIAARMAPAGIGEDTGGSTRIPAAFCGIAGLRPSTFTLANLAAGLRRKRYPDEGILPPPGLAETAGPMARSVVDLALIDAALTGEATPTVSLRGARIGVPDDRYWAESPVDAGVRAVFDEASGRLAAAGAELIAVDLKALVDCALGAPAPMGVSAATLERWVDDSLADLPAEARASLLAHPAAAVREATVPDQRAPIAEVERRHRAAFEDGGLLALAFPTQMMPAPAIDPDFARADRQIEVGGRQVSELATVLAATLWGAVVGSPALSLPVGLTAGLPVGLTLQGLPGDDARILGLGIAAEAVLGRLVPPARG